MFIFFFKQKTAYEMRISYWSSDVCSSDLGKRTQLYKRLSSVREIAPESPQDAFIILCLQIQLELGKKLAGRERAKNKRLSKRYGTRLSGGLFNFLSGDQQAEIASEPASQNALRALLFPRSEEHTSELQSLMRISYAVFCFNKKNKPPPYSTI